MEFAEDPAVDVNWGDEELGRTPFYRACGHGRLNVVEYLMKNARVDVMKPNNKGATVLFIACAVGEKEVVSLLLADPKIDTTKPDRAGATPFFMACQQDQWEVVLLLLADPRIDPNKTMNDRGSPLWQASQNGNLMVVQHLLASGREIDTKVTSSFNDSTAAEQGRLMGTRTSKVNDETDEDFERMKTTGPLCADLIDEYERDPMTMRHRLRCQPRLREYFIGHLFALVVFHSDNFVVTRDNADVSCKRFFDIASRLPLEVQMVLCNRVFGSPKDIILSRDSEPGFKFLVRTTTWQQ